MRSSSQKGNKRKRRGASSSNNEDRISQLPNDILISIISRLPLKEATATSILSKTFRHLYTYTTRLDFPKLTREYTTYEEMVDIKTRRLPNYINTIDRFLDSHKGDKVKEFRVHTFSLEGASVGRWLDFALAKKVETMDIHYKHYIYYPLQRTNLISGVQPSECLKELLLHGILVDDGEFELLLRRFPLLEILAMVHVQPLRNVSIVGSFSGRKLKHLEISNAGDVELIHIDGLMDLVSLKCHTLPIDYSLIVNNVPNLIEFNTFDHASPPLEAFRTSTVADILPGFPSTVRDQLQTLKVFWSFKCSQVYREMQMQLIGVKTLELRLWLCETTVPSPHELFYLMEACPSLEKLEIKSSWVWTRKLRAKVKEEYFIRRVSKKWRLPNLKRVKFSGFGGSSLELEIACCILDNAVEVVEELVVEVGKENRAIRKMAIDRVRTHLRPTEFPNPFTLLII